MEKIALYCRVSTSHQEEEKTIEVQIEELKRVYKNRNVVKTYRDDGFSGSYLDRPALNELRNDAKNGLFNIIAVYNIDRLSRKVVHQLLLISEFKKLGVNLEISGRNFEDNPQGQFSLTVLSAAAQLEKDLIVQRMRDGKYRKARAGELMNLSTLPYGLEIIKENGKNVFKRNALEANNVSKIFQIYLATESIRETIRRITKLGIYTRSGKVWTTKGIGNLLRNETFIGNFYFGKSYPVEPKNPKLEKNKGRETSRRMRPKTEWILIRVKPILDKTIFDKAQKILKERNERGFYRNSKYQYLCSGLVRCVHCGKLYYGRPNAHYFSKGENKEKTFLSYMCSGRSKPALKKDRCLGSKMIGVNKLDKIIWDYVKNLILNPKIVRKTILETANINEKKRKENEGVRDALLEEKAKINLRKTKLFDFYSSPAYEREKDILNQKIADCRRIEDLIDIQISEVEMKLLTMVDIKEIEKNIDSICSIYSEIVSQKEMPFDNKKTFVRNWISEIHLLDGKIEIKMRLPNLFETLGENNNTLLNNPSQPLFQRNTIEFSSLVNIN